MYPFRYPGSCFSPNQDTLGHPHCHSCVTPTYHRCFHGSWHWGMGVLQEFGNKRVEKSMADVSIPAWSSATRSRSRLSATLGRGCRAWAWATWAPRLFLTAKKQHRIHLKVCTSIRVAFTMLKQWTSFFLTDMKATLPGSFTLPVLTTFDSPQNKSLFLQCLKMRNELAQNLHFQLFFSALCRC